MPLKLVNTVSVRKMLEKPYSSTKSSKLACLLTLIYSRVRINVGFSCHFSIGGIGEADHQLVPIVAGVPHSKTTEAV